MQNSEEGHEVIARTILHFKEGLEKASGATLLAKVDSTKDYHPEIKVFSMSCQIYFLPTHAKDWIFYSRDLYDQSHQHFRSRVERDQKPLIAFSGNLTMRG